MGFEKIVQSGKPQSTQATSPSAPARGAKSGDGRDEPLFYLGCKAGRETDPFTFENAFQGTQIFGATGSGKTSGSGQALAVAFLRARYEKQYPFGGLVLTAKPDDLDQWVGYCYAAEMTEEEIRERLVVVRPPGLPHPSSIHPETRDSTGRRTGMPLDLEGCVCTGFNFLDYEFRAGRGTRKSGGLTQDLVSLFVNCMAPGGAAVSRTDPYWDDALRELLTHAIDLAVFGTRAEAMAAGSAADEPRVLLDDLVEIIRTAPQSKAEAASASWRNPSTSLCWRYLNAANEQLAKRGTLIGEGDGGRLHDLERTIEFWMHAFPSLNDRTRSVIVSSFTSKAAGLLRHPLRELLCGLDFHGANATPDETFRGKIVVLDLPVKLYGEVGRFAQTIWKAVWQRATERRVGSLTKRDSPQSPVFLWADESQYFITREDALFQQTARSARAATVYLTQNISNYYAAMGGDSSRAAVDSLLGNLQTKIFHANGDPVTNDWAESLFSDWVGSLQTRSTGSDPSRSTADSHLPLVRASRFTILAKGGPQSGYKVEAYVFQGGRLWTGDGCVHTREGKQSTALLTEFKQVYGRQHEDK